MAYQNYSKGGYNAPSPRDNQGGRSRYNDRQPVAAEPIQALPLPENYLEQAEELMRERYSLISTSKIRRLYSLATEIYNNEKLRTEENLLPESSSAVAMMRVSIAYEAGRDSKVKDFVKETKLLEYLKGLNNKRENFMKFTQYMEALVAFHKFFGGREIG